MGATGFNGQSIERADKKRLLCLWKYGDFVYGDFSGAGGFASVFCEAAVAVMSTPAEAVSGTAAYLTICFLGIPFITAYNVISSIFRGLGDS